MRSTPSFFLGNILKQAMIVILAVGVLLSIASTSQASIFHIEIATAGLNLAPASANAPFSLDFQFNDGGVLGNNTATISNFTYGGGSATGTATTLGGAAGDISSTITFNNSSAFQEVYQTFTPGTTVGFDVILTQNVDGSTPDSFVVAILDNNLFSIPTTGLGDSLVQVDINSTNAITYDQLNPSSGTGDYAGIVASAAAVPEPTTIAIWGGLGLMGLIAARRRK